MIARYGTRGARGGLRPRACRVARGEDVDVDRETCLALPTFWLAQLGIRAAVGFLVIGSQGNSAGEPLAACPAIGSDGARHHGRAI
jgi:hypothetical protein